MLSVLALAVVAATSASDSTLGSDENSSQLEEHIEIQSRRRLRAITSGNTCLLKTGDTDVQGDKLYSPARKNAIASKVTQIITLQRAIESEGNSIKRAKLVNEVQKEKARLASLYSLWKDDAMQAAHKAYFMSKNSVDKVPIKLHFHSGHQNHFSISSIRALIAEFVDNPARTLNFAIYASGLGKFSVKAVQFSQNTIRGRMLASGYFLSTIFFIQGIMHAVQRDKVGQLWTFSGTLMNIGLGLQVLGVGEDVYNTMAALQYFGRKATGPSQVAAKSLFLFSKTVQGMTMTKVLNRYMKSAWSSLKTSKVMMRSMALGASLKSVGKYQRVFSALNVKAFMRGIRPVVLGLDAVISIVWLGMSVHQYIKNQDPRNRDPDMDTMLIAQISISAIGVAVVLGSLACAAGAAVFTTGAAVLTAIGMALNILMLPVMLVSFFVSLALTWKYEDEMEADQFSIYLIHFGQQVHHFLQPSYLIESKSWHDMPSLNGEEPMRSYLTFDQICVNEHDYNVTINQFLLDRLKSRSLTRKVFPFSLDSMVLPANYYDAPGHAYCDNFGFGRRLQGAPSVVLKKLRDGKLAETYEATARGVVYVHDPQDPDCPPEYSYFGRDLDYVMPRLKKGRRVFHLVVNKTTLIMISPEYPSMNVESETVTLEILYKIDLYPVQNSRYLPPHYTLSIPATSRYPATLHYEMTNKKKIPLLITLQWDGPLLQDSLSIPYVVAIAQQFMLPRLVGGWYIVEANIADTSRKFTFRSRSLHVAFQISTRLCQIDIDWESKTFTVFRVTYAIPKSQPWLDPAIQREETMVSLMDVLQYLKDFKTSLRHCLRCAPFHLVWKPVSIDLANHHRPVLFYNPSHDFGTTWHYVCPTYISDARRTDLPSVVFRCGEVHVFDHLDVHSALPLSHGLRVTYIIPVLESSDWQLIVLYPPTGLAEIKGVKCESCTLYGILRSLRTYASLLNMLSVNDTAILTQFSEDFYIKDVRKNLTRLYVSGGHHQRYLEYDDSQQVFLAYFSYGDCFYTHSQNGQFLTVTRHRGHGNENPLHNNMNEEVTPPALPHTSQHVGWTHVVAMQPYVILMLADGTRMRSSCLGELELVVATFDPTAINQSEYAAHVNLTSYPPEKIVFNSARVRIAGQLQTRRVLWTEDVYVLHPDAHRPTVYQFLGFYDVLDCYLFIDQKHFDTTGLDKEARCVKKFIADPCRGKQCGALEFPDTPTLTFFLKEDVSVHLTSIYAKSDDVAFAIIPKYPQTLFHHLSFDATRHKLHLRFVAFNGTDRIVDPPRPILYSEIVAADSVCPTFGDVLVHYRGCHGMCIPAESQLVSIDDMRDVEETGQIAGTFRGPEDALLNLVYDAASRTCSVDRVVDWALIDVDTSILDMTVLKLQVQLSGDEILLPSSFAGMSVIEVILLAAHPSPVLKFITPPCDSALKVVVLLPTFRTKIMFANMLLTEDTQEIACGAGLIEVRASRGPPEIFNTTTTIATTPSGGCGACDGIDEVCVLEKYCESVSAFYRKLINALALGGHGDFLSIDVRGHPIALRVCSHDIAEPAASEHCIYGTFPDELLVVKVKTYEVNGQVKFSCDRCTRPGEIRHYLCHWIMKSSGWSQALRGKQFDEGYTQIMLSTKPCPGTKNGTYSAILQASAPSIFPAQTFYPIRHDSCAAVLSWNENPVLYRKMMYTAFNFMWRLKEKNIDIQQRTLIGFVHQLLQFVAAQLHHNVYVNHICLSDFLVTMYTGDSVPANAKLTWLPSNSDSKRVFDSLEEQVYRDRTSHQSQYYCQVRFGINVHVVPDCQGERGTMTWHIGCVIRTLLHHISPKEQIRPSERTSVVHSAAQDLETIRKLWEEPRRIDHHDATKNLHAFEHMFEKYPRFLNCTTPVFSKASAAVYMKKQAKRFRDYRYQSAYARYPLDLSGGDNFVDGTCQIVHVLYDVWCVGSKGTVLPGSPDMKLTLISDGVTEPYEYVSEMKVSSCVSTAS